MFRSSRTRCIPPLPAAYDGAKLTVDAERILLPTNQLSGEAVGDVVSVFVYLDSSDRPIATKLLPKAEFGLTALLTVKQVNRVGAFLDWGLPKDLLLPYREQTRPVSEGDEIGELIIKDRDGTVIERVPVLAGKSVEKAGFGKLTLDNIGNM